MIKKRLKYIVILCSMFFIVIYCINEQILEVNTMSKSETYKIKMIVGDSALTATLIDNPTTRDFISLLPIYLKLDDYSGTEKISYLSKKLSIEKAPSGFDPSVGDLTYYAPWGNLAIFYKDFGYANGLINLGKIDSGIEVFNTLASLNVRIELIK